MIHSRSYSFFFYPNHCIHCNIWLLIYHSNFAFISITVPVKQWTDSQSLHLQNQKKHSSIMHKQPLTFQR